MIIGIPPVVLAIWTSNESPVVPTGQNLYLQIHHRCGIKFVTTPDNKLRMELGQP